MSYSRILVAADRSPQGKAVLDRALDIASKDGARLLLFHCIPFEGQEVSAYGGIYGQDLVNVSQLMQERLESEANEVGEWLSQQRQRAEAAGVAAETDWKVGEAGSWIRELARNWEADLVVVGRRGRRGLAKMVLGSVSNHVVHHAPCSVLVVQGTDLPDEAEAGEAAQTATG